MSGDLLARAAAARRAGSSEDARALYRTAAAEALAGLGQTERDLGNPDAALAAYAQAVRINRARGDQDRVAHNLRHIGDILSEARRFAEALPLHEEALALYRARPETRPLDLANALRGTALAREGAGADARVLWAEARDLYAAEGVPDGVRECERRIAGTGE